MRAAIPAALFVAILSTALPGAAEDYMASHDPDGIACGYSNVHNVSPISGETGGAWLNRHVAADWGGAMTPTTARDPIRFDFAPSLNFVGHVGGGGGFRAIYDPVHRLLAECEMVDTAEIFSLFENVPQPPFGVPHRDLASFATSRGIRLGSTTADVRRVYGQALVARFRNGGSGLAYQRYVPTPGGRAPATFTPFAIETWFTIVNGRVTSIQRMTGF